MNFKTNLSAALENVNIAALARESGISDETIRSILAGRSSDPLLSTVVKIAQGLGISLDSLVLNKEITAFGEFPFDEKLWKEGVKFTETYIKDNKLANTIQLKQLLCAINSILEYSVANNIKTIDKRFALWTCKKNFGK